MFFTYIFFKFLWETKPLDQRTHGVCVSCYEICVPTNGIILLEGDRFYFGGNFYCDCGAGNLAKPCLCHKTLSDH